MTDDQLVRLIIGPTRYKRRINKDEVIRKQSNCIDYLSETLTDLSIITLGESIKHILLLLLYFFNFDKYATIDFAYLLADASDCILNVYNELPPKNKDAINRYFFIKNSKGKNLVQSILYTLAHSCFSNMNMAIKEIYVPEVLDKATCIEDLIIDDEALKQNPITKEVLYRLQSVKTQQFLSGKDSNDEEE